MKCLDHENAVGLQRLAAKIDRRERQACGPGLVDIRDSREVRREVREHDVRPYTFQHRGAEISRHHHCPSDGGNLQQINGDDATAGLDPGGGHLRPAARRRTQVYYDCSRPQKLFLVVYLEKLERRAGTIALLPLGVQASRDRRQGKASAAWSNRSEEQRLNSSHHLTSYADFCLKK